MILSEPYLIILHPDSPVGYSVEIPAVQVWTQGDSIDECIAMAKDAIVCVLPELRVSDVNVVATLGKPIG